MGKLGKILAPIVALLAIAAAVLSFLISQGFNKYRDRASKMAQGLADTATKLDSQSNSGTAAKVKFTAQAPGVKESGSLAYAEYKKAPDTYAKTVASVGELAQKVNSQRNELADNIAAMSISLGLPADNISTDELKALASYSPKIKLSKDYTDAFRKRDDELTAGIKQFASALKCRDIDALDSLPTIEENSETGDVQVKYVEQAPAIKAVSSAIAELLKRKSAYEQAIAASKKVISEFDAWTVNITRLSGKDYADVLKALATDLAAVNGKLAELKRVKSELEQAQAELKKLEKQITGLKDNLEDLTAKNKALHDKLKFYGFGDEQQEQKVISSVDDVDPDTKGEVILDNKHWNYVITNLGKYAVANGTEVMISNNGTYIASGKVTKVEEEISVIEITRRKTDVIPKGATVFMGDNVNDNDNSPDDDDDDD